MDTKTETTVASVSAGALDHAITLGFLDIEHLTQDPDFASLRDTEALNTRIARMRELSDSADEDSCLTVALAPGAEAADIARWRQRYPLEKETEIGRKAAEEIDREYGILDDPEQLARLQAIVSEIVRKHQGTITVGTSPQGGALFTIVIPVPS